MLCSAKSPGFGFASPLKKLDRFIKKDGLKLKQPSLGWMVSSVALEWNLQNFESF